jgi:hypothetical protein
MYTTQKEELYLIACFKAPLSFKVKALKRVFFTKNSHEINQNKTKTKKILLIKTNITMRATGNNPNYFKQLKKKSIF